MRFSWERAAQGKRWLVLRASCRVCFVGLCLVGVCLLTLGVLTSRAGYFLIVDDELQQADAIIVLAGGVSRTNHAVHLYEQGYAPLVVFSNAMIMDVGLDCSWAQLSTEDAKKLGLPADAIIVAGEAESTYDEAVNVRRLVQEHGWQSLIVVTDASHTRRAASVFRKLLPEVTVYPSAAFDPRFDCDRWWQTEYGLKTVFGETIKLAFYWAKYGISPLDL